MGFCIHKSCIHASFYSFFLALCTKLVAIEHWLKAEPGYLLTNQGLEFGSDGWMASPLIQRSSNRFKFDHGREINNCGLCLDRML